MGSTRFELREGLRTVAPELAERYRAEGWWAGTTMGAVAESGLAALHDEAFVVHSQMRPWRGTFAEVDTHARALAGRLAAEGVGAGDVVVLQLPNWMEAGWPSSPPPTSAQWSCPSCTSTGRRRSATSSAPPTRRSSSPPRRSATPTTSRCTTSCSPSTPTPGGSSSASRAPHSRAPPRRGDLRPRPGRARGRGGPRRAGTHRLHLGHHATPRAWCTRTTRSCARPDSSRR